MTKNKRLSLNWKTIITSLVVLSSGYISAQTASVWGKVDNLNKLERSIVYVQAAQSLNIKHRQVLPSSKSDELLKVLEFSCDCNETDLYIALNNVNEIKNIEYGPKYEALTLPNDFNHVFDPLWSLDLINAEGAWDLTHGDPSVNVAVSDQNYFTNHEELIGKVNYYDASNTSSQTHGTAVAITVAGNTNNGLGLSSIGYDLGLHLYTMNYNEVLAASYAGARVINLSWTSGCSFNQYCQDVMNEVYDNGTFIVAAAGNGSTCGGNANNGASLVYPSAYENVFSVTSIGASDNHEKIIGDPTSTHQHNSTVDLSAPGYNVPISAGPAWYLYGSGTSYAAPFVTGTVGLMLSVNPCLSHWEIENYLKQSAVNIDALNPNYVGLLGAGRLNAQGAVSLAANSISNSDPCGPEFNGCDPNQSVWAGLCQTTFWGYTDEYAEVDLNALTSGGYGATSSVWTDQNGNIVATGNNSSFLTNASSVSSGDYITSIYTLTYTDEYGCAVSDEVEVTTYNVICAKPNSIMDALPNFNQRRIMVCSKGGFRCVPYYDVTNVLDACSNCKLGPCDAIQDCKGAGSPKSMSTESSSINVYPNPSHGILNIVSQENDLIDKIEIYNHMGQLIDTKFNAYNFEVDLTNQSRGLYYVKAYVGKQIISSVVTYF